jgi:hypothetical protein
MISNIDIISRDDERSVSIISMFDIIRNKAWVGAAWIAEPGWRGRIHLAPQDLMYVVGRASARRPRG